MKVVKMATLVLLAEKLRLAGNELYKQGKMSEGLFFSFSWVLNCSAICILLLFLLGDNGWFFLPICSAPTALEELYS